MVIPSGRVSLVSGVEFAQDRVERAVMPLAQDFDPVTDQERRTDSLLRMERPFDRAPSKITWEPQAALMSMSNAKRNVVLLRHPQYGCATPSI